MSEKPLFPPPALRPVDPEDASKFYVASNLDPALWIGPAQRRRTLDVHRAAAEARALGVHPAEIKSTLLGGDYNLAGLPFEEFQAAVLLAVDTVTAAPSAAVALVNAGGSPSSFTAADLLSMELLPPRWIVEDVFPEGTTLLGGKPKSGKSFLALQVSLAVCSGGVALGRARVLTEPGAGLYIHLDPGGLGGMQQRVRSMLAGENGAETPPSFEFHRRWPRGTEGVERIGQWLEEHEDARIVVVDTLGHFRKPPDGKVNPYDADYAATSEIAAMFSRYGVSGIIVHHTSKRPSETVDSPMDLFSGTTGLLAGVENGAVIMRTSKGDLLSVQPREFEPADHMMERQKDGLWQRLGDAAEYLLSAQKQAILDALKQNSEGLIVNELAQVADIPNQGSLRRQLGRLRDEGFVIKQNNKWIALTPTEKPVEGAPSVSPPSDADPF